MVLLAVVVLLFVVRPLVRRIVTPDKPMQSQAAIAAALAGGDMQAALAAGATPEELVAGTSQTAKMIDIAQVQGQVHAQSVQKVGELADKNPTETVSIIRTWLHETPA
jgi:flagellar M-ring protein FliF